MKKTGIALMALIISISTLAQDSITQEAPSQVSGDIENQFYLRFAYLRATKSYLGAEDMEFWDNFKRYGGVFELGHIFIINKAALADGLRFGINVDYAEFSYNQIAGKDIDYDLGVPKLASKIGPSLSYRPSSNLIIDLFVKAKLTWVAGIIPWSDEVEDVYLAKPGIGIATGLNIRYGLVMLGFEFNSDNLKYESNDYPDTYFGNLTDNGDNTPMPSFNFSIGVCF